MSTPLRLAVGLAASVAVVGVAADVVFPFSLHPPHKHGAPRLLPLGRAVFSTPGCAPFLRAVGGWGFSSGGHGWQFAALVPT